MSFSLIFSSSYFSSFSSECTNIKSFSKLKFSSYLNKFLLLYSIGSVESKSILSVMFSKFRSLGKIHSSVFIVSPRFNCYFIYLYKLLSFSWEMSFTIILLDSIVVSDVFTKYLPLNLLLELLYAKSYILLKSLSLKCTWFLLEVNFWFLI